MSEATAPESRATVLHSAVLRSDRLQLSAPDDGDVDTIAALCQDPEIQRWTTVPSPYTRDDATGFVRDVVGPGWENGTARTWGIRPVGDKGAAGSLVGMIGLDRVDAGGAELGFWLSHAARGAGVMSEAVRLVLDFGFDALGLQRIVWHAFVGNTPSASVARRAGFRFEGTSRLGGVQREARVDNWRAGLLADDPRTPASGWPAETFSDRSS